MNRRALAALGLVTLALVADRAVIALSPAWAWMDCFAMTPGASPCIRARPRCRATFTGFIHRSHSSADFTLASLGHRAPERAPRPAEGTRRLAVFGASNVFGFGVRDGEDWPSLVESQLARVEVVNLALPGHDLAQQVALAVEAVPRLGAHHALVVAGAEELEPTDCQAWSSLFAKPGAASGLVRAWRLARTPLRPRDPEAARDHGIRAAIETLRAHPDLRVTLLVTASLGENESTHARRVAAIERAGVRVIDAREALRGVLDGGDSSLWDVGGEQLNARGHRAVADRVGPQIAEILR